MRGKRRWAAVLILVAAGSSRAGEDWDLYMLRLVNRARLDPAGEATRIGSSVTDSTPSRPPLAYNLQVETAATNHNNWMHDNFGNAAISSGFVPNSHTHFETLNGQQFGTPATGTPSFTGADTGVRLTAAGFSWDWAAENITTTWSTDTIPINQARVDANHKGWWESSGHRSNMLSSNYTVFGHRFESRTFTPPRGGINAPFDNIHFATQNFARPLNSPKTYLIALIYRDLDANNTWTPRNNGDPLREGEGGKSFQVFNAGTATLVASGTTMPTGALAVKIGNGTYDVEISGITTAPLGKVRIEGVVLSGQNVDAGDLNTTAFAPADFNGDRRVDADDLDIFKACATRSAVPYNPASPPPGCPAPYGSSYVAPDFDHDSDVDLSDFAVLQRCYSGAAMASANCAN